MTHTIANKIRWSHRCAGEYTATHGDHTFEILHVETRDLGDGYGPRDHWLLIHTGPTGTPPRTTTTTTGPASRSTRSLLPRPRPRPLPPLPPGATPASPQARRPSSSASTRTRSTTPSSTTEPHGPGVAWLPAHTHLARITTKEPPP